MPSLTIGSSGSGLARGGEGLHLGEDAFIASVSPNYVNSGDGPVFNGFRITYDGKSYLFWYGGGHTPDGYMEVVSGVYQYTKANGDVIELTPKTTIFPNNRDYWYVDGEAVVTKVTKANGEILQYYYERVAGSGAPSPPGYVSLKTIKSSLGWVIRYAAVIESPSAVDVRMYNASVDYCDVANSSSVCTLSRPWYYLKKTSAGIGSVKISKNDVDIATYTLKPFQGDRQYNSSVITKVLYPSGRSVQIDYWDKTPGRFPDVANIRR